jgi:hypothetical protein
VKQNVEFGYAYPQVSQLAVVKHTARFGIGSKALNRLFQAFRHAYKGEEKQRTILLLKME